MDEELRDLLKKLEDLIKKGNKEDFNRELENLEMNSNDLKEQLDRSLEMLKKLQLDEKIDDVEKELKELAKQQERAQFDIRINSKKIQDDVYGILAAPPCTEFAGSGARWWEEKGKKPLLGVCYGAQYIAHFEGGKVIASNKREYGRASLSSIDHSNLLFKIL